ncbi:sugar ABC transporter [Candidatus Vecturithrix granuli]|uniref:Sugar ABC transporter n=1 Tax=Vecturithrix granuli TaxID=1499967 RepID=A0A0S6W7C8_VECG1|nr:sugar ABC transporter [Candidatus Vecturithrix granuli]
MEQQQESSKNQLIVMRRKTVALLLEYGIFVAFFVLCIVLAFASPYFLMPKNLINVLRQISINGFLSIGMTFVILTGGIDLSVGSVLAFGGIVGASMASSSMGTVYPTPIAILVGLLAGTALGAVTGFFIAKWRMAPFVVSLGMLSVARGLTYIYTDGMPVPKLEESFLYIGQGRIAAIPLPVIIFAVIFILSWIVLYKTRFGRYVYAVGGNEKSARISGVNTRLVVFVVYVISGFLAALGGLTLSARTSAGLPQAGVAYELDAIAAVVIGGTSLSGGQGSLVGTLFGALIIGVINNGLDLLGVSSYYQQVIKGAIIVGAVWLDSLRKGKE